MRRVFKGRPPRLTEVFQKDGLPLYFITLNTLGRKPVLACSAVHDAWIAYAEKGVEFGVGVGRYVIMPDHIHAFVRIAPDMTLVRWGTGIKRFLGTALKNIGVDPTVCSHGGLKSYWQPGLFDHLLRSSESYAEKWAYVSQNPVRAGLVENALDWPYQGEIVIIDRI